MDRMKPVEVREKSTISGGGTDAQLSPPPSSSMHMHSRSASMLKRSQNTKAAAQRLAQMMTNQQTDDSEDEDDFLSDYSPPASQLRPRSMTVRTATEQHSAPPAASVGRSSQPQINLAELRRQSIQSSSSASNSMEQIHPQSDQPSNTVEQIQTSSRLRSSPSPEHVQPTSARVKRSPQLARPAEQPSSARAVSAGRPSLGMKPISMVPPSVPLSLRPTSSGGQGDNQFDTQKNRRLSLDLGAFHFRETSNQRLANASTSALQDEIDMLQEENDNLLEKLRIAEDRCEEAEVRARQLEKQVANLGEGVSLEARLLTKKEAALQQREAALKAAEAQTAAENIALRGGEIEALRVAAETARDEAASIMEQLHVTESDVKSYKRMTQRMVLTKEEMEEVVLKRCWLARYWSLCVQHGIHAEIAGARYEYWSSFAPLPVEVVIAAGQKARDDYLMVNNDKEERKKVPKDPSEISGEGSVESMFLVERGLREMTFLKIEDAVALAMAQQRRPNTLKSALTVDETKLPIKCQHSGEAYELSKQESDDVMFKQAWLTYFWRRVKIHGLEPDIADERLQFWIKQGDHPPTSHDAVDVERGLLELRKLGIEAQLWQASRKLVDPDSEHKWKMHNHF